MLLAFEGSTCAMSRAVAARRAASSPPRRHRSRLSSRHTWTTPVEPVVIALRGRRIGVNKATAVADHHIVGSGQRIALGHDEFLVMADSVASGAAGCASAMWKGGGGTAAGGAMHVALARRAAATGWRMHRPKTRHGCGESRRGAEFRRVARVRRAPARWKARNAERAFQAWARVS